MKSTIIRFLPAVVLAVAGVADAKVAARVSSTIPFVIEKNFGSRPIVAASVSGLSYRFMIHSNAGSPVQMNHKWASRAKVYDLHHNGAYGVIAPGKLSALGRDEGILPNFKLGRREYRNMRVSVFETPNLDDIGMLGTGWLHDADVVMDFASRVLRLDMSAQDRAAYDRRLRSSGYSVIPMRYDPVTRRYLVNATVGGASRPMVVSTVADLALDTGFASDAGVARGPVIAELEGPAGAVLPSYQIAKPIVLKLGPWTSAPTAGQIQDVYAYQNAVRPAVGVIGGMLGADFLIANHAIINFQDNRLYLRR